MTAPLPQLVWMQRLSADESLSRSARHVGTVIGLYLGFDLRSTIGRRQLMTLTGYGEAAVKAAVRRLRETGWVHVEEYGRKGRVSRFRADVPGLLTRSMALTGSGVIPPPADPSIGVTPGTPESGSGVMGMTPEDLNRASGVTGMTPEAPDRGSSGVMGMTPEELRGHVSDPHDRFRGHGDDPLLKVEVGEGEGTYVGGVAAVDEEEIERTVLQLPEALRPGTAEALRLRELVEQRMRRGWTRDDILRAVERRLQPGQLTNPCGLFAKRLVPLDEAPPRRHLTVARPWCGGCDEATRRPLDENDLPDFTRPRCADCAQLEFAAAMVGS